jgi:hypothetical protein
VPDTFRSEPDSDLVGPRLGALSLAAILAVAVAALRGTHTVLSTWWADSQARQAETGKTREARLKHQLAMQNIGDKAAQQRAKKVPSSSDFGRKTLGNRPSSGGGAGGGGKGPGRKGPGASGGGASSGTGGKDRTRPTRSPKNTGTGAGPLGGGAGTGRGPGSGKGGEQTPPKSPRTTRDKSGQNHGGLRTNKTTDSSGRKQLAPTRGTDSPAGKKNRPGKDSGRRTKLRQAAAKQAQKAAARRLKQRRNTPDTPAVWSGKTKAPKNPKNPSAGTKNSKGPGKKPSTGTGPGRKNRAGRRKKVDPTTLTGAMGHGAYRAARRRLKRRRRTVTPPIWSAPRNRKHTTRPTSKNTAKTRGGGQRKQNPTNGGRTNTWWSRARAYARAKAATGGCFGGSTSPGSSTPGGPAGNGSQAGQGPSQGAPGGSGGYGTWTPGPGPGRRRSPFENAGQATTGTTHTVERDDYPGAQARQWEPAAITTGRPVIDNDSGPAALDPAPTPHTARPGTTRTPTPIPMPPAASPSRQETRTMAARIITATGGHSMSAEHATEITLDDALDEAGQFAQDAFKTHDECGRLAKKAHALRVACMQLSEELATKHNLIGRLFQGALARFIESMDLVDRMAQEMETSSLDAAELAEALSNDLEDAYRPYTQATADAGLTTPSAPVHNQA